MNKSKLLQKWEAARDDLDLDIVAPFEINIGGDLKVRADILVRNFGGRNGTIIIKDYAIVRPHLEQLRKLGYGFSVLGESSEAYNREIFIEMLSEWEWTGDQAKKPRWFAEAK